MNMGKGEHHEHGIYVEPDEKNATTDGYNV